MGGRPRLDVVVRKALEDRLPRRLHGIHAQIEGRGLLQPAREREQRRVIHVLAHALDHPIGKVGANLERERIDGGRLQEWVERSADQKVTYRNESARRSLSLVIQRTDAVASFDPAIWHF